MSADIVAVNTVQSLSSLRFGQATTPLFDPADFTSTDVMTSDAFPNGCSLLSAQRSCSFTSTRILDSLATFGYG